MVAKKAAPKKVVKKAAPKRAAPKKTVAKKTVAKKAVPVKKAPARVPRSKQRSAGGTTSDFKPGRQFAKRGSSFSLQEMFGFKIARDSSGRALQSYEKPKRIIK